MFKTLQVIPVVHTSKAYLELDCFQYKNGRTEYGIVLKETPYTYFVQFDYGIFGTVYKNQLKEAGPIFEEVESPDEE